MCASRLPREEQRILAFISKKQFFSMNPNEKNVYFPIDDCLLSVYIIFALLKSKFLSEIEKRIIHDFDRLP